MFIEHIFFLFGRQPITNFFFRNSVNLIPILMKVTLRVHYETLNCV